MGMDNLKENDMSKQTANANTAQDKRRQDRQGVSSAFIDRIISAQKNSSHPLEN